jgi:hypothetical protein
MTLNNLSLDALLNTSHILAFEHKYSTAGTAFSPVKHRLTTAVSDLKFSFTFIHTIKFQVQI